MALYIGTHAGSDRLSHPERAALTSGFTGSQEPEYSVSALDFDDNSFDLATAFETVYFWPGLRKCFAEVFRVLKPGGCFMIVNESDGKDDVGRKFEKMIDGMKLYTAEEIEDAMRSAGFTKVKTIRHMNQPWITVLAGK